MAVINVDLDAQYIPHGQEEPIEVRVDIGNGQPGSYSIFVGQELKGVNNPTIIGNGRDIKGKRTLVTTTIRDVLQETNWTSIIIHVSEGSNSVKFGPYSKEVPIHSDTCIYALTIVHA